MTADRALFNFFSGVGMPAYPETAVPDDTVMPYLTYTTAFGAWGDVPVSLTVKMWFHTESETVPTEKAWQVMRRIGAGTNIPCDGGCIFLTMGQPRCVAFTHESDKTIKGRMLNISAAYNILI